MSDEPSVEAGKTAWQSQHVDAPHLSLEYLRHRAAEQIRQSRARSALEYLLGGIAALMCVWFAVTIEGTLFRVGALIMLSGILISVYAWWRQGMLWSVTVEGTALNGLHFYRQELVRLRDRHRGLWTVYLPAAAPGTVLLLTWVFLERSTVDGVLLTVGVVIWVIAALRHEAKVASRYERELHALESGS